HRLRELERGVERLDHPLVGVAAVVGRSACVPAVLQLDVSDVERREALDHSKLLRARYALAGASVLRSTFGSSRRAGSTATRALLHAVRPVLDADLASTHGVMVVGDVAGRENAGHVGPALVVDDDPVVDANRRAGD